MGREVRRVTANWQHPKDSLDNYIPLKQNYEEDYAGFMKMLKEDGLQAAIDYYGEAPDMYDYMPTWSDEEKTHYMMYEDCTEGTPISPAFETPEELARWLADTGASAFGSMVADYEHWLAVAKGAWACSVIMENNTISSGVQALSLEV